MAIDHDARLEFAAALVRRRELAGFTQIALRDELVREGHPTTQQNIGKWENGAGQPDRAQMAALETILDAPGLGLILGVDTGALARLTDEISQLRARVERLEAQSAPSLPEGAAELLKAALSGNASRLFAAGAGQPTHRPQPPPMSGDEGT